MIRLMIVDDHAPTREQAVRDLSGAGLVQVVAEAETSDEAFKKAQQHLPDMVLLDLHLPGLIATVDLIKRLINLRNVKVIMFAGEAKASEVHNLLEAGASAFVLKSDQPALIRMTMLMVSRGSKNVISPTMPRFLTHLTVYERNILAHVTARGGIPKAAERLGITQEAMEETLQHLAEKIELENVEDIVKWAKKHGF